MHTNYITNSSYPTPLPFIDNINLSVDDYNITEIGIYNITVGTDGYILSFPNPASLPGARIVITNTDYNNNWVGVINSANIPLQGATFEEIPEIKVGITYNFVSDGEHWRNLPLTGVTSIASDGAIDDNSTITKGGVYCFNPNYDSSPYFKRLYIVPAAALDGETVTIFNPDSFLNTCKLQDFNLYDIDNSLTVSFFMDPNSVIEIISVGGNWRIVNYQVV